MMDTDGLKTDLLSEREQLLRYGMRLELFSICWDIVESTVEISAGLVARSTTLVGAGLEGAIEVTAAGTLYWRLNRELKGNDPSEQAEQRALKVLAAMFLLLALYVSSSAIFDLVRGEGADSSVPGILMAIAALLVMPFLALAKRRTGIALKSESLIADSRETIASSYLSFTVLAGLGLQMAFGWWWSDAVAALCMIPYLLWAGWSAWSESKGK